MVRAVVFLIARSAGGSLAELTAPLTALVVLGTFAVVAIVVIRVTADPFESSSVAHP